MRLDTRTRAWICAALALTLTAGGFVMPPRVAARTERKPVIISFGKPNIWSLEQAHYLLARMHERSLDLASRTPTDADLDPNATNASRVSTLKSLLEVSTAFEQRPPVPDASPSASPAASASPVAIPTPDRTRLPEGIVDKLLEDKDFRDSLRRDVRLAATTALDNHIQMQYEIIAKQLTLLRDELGPNERLVFLELPQSIYTTPGKSEGKLAQVWWRVADVTYNRPLIRDDDLISLKSQHRKIESEVKGVSEQLSNHTKERVNVEAEIEVRRARNQPVEPLLKRLATLDADIVSDRQRLALAYESINDLTEREAEALAMRQQGADAEQPPENAQEALRLVRTVDLIPRQSSLNVNEIQDTVKAGALTSVFSFLFGFGAKVSFQRQRELYEQYIHQETFASGFGKGARDFGWTFGPLPGSKRVAPGIRTTYAVMVIPKNVTELKLSSSGCYFPRKRNAPQGFDDTADADWKRPNKLDDYQCVPHGEQFSLSVPGSRGNGFFVTGVSYQPAVPGQRLAVSLRGRDFSTQLGVLVDGVPLCPSAGVAQPLLTPRKCTSPVAATADEISGEFERLNARQLMLTFRMPTTYKGTPTITIVTPGRAINLNHLMLNVNGVPDQKLAGATTPLMFGKRQQDELTLAGLDIFDPDPKNREVIAVLTGTLFDENKDVLFVNGRRLEKGKHILVAKPTFYQLKFDLPDSDTVDIALIQGDEYVRKSFAHPSRLGIAEAAVLAFEKEGEKMVLSLRVKGFGFGERPQASVGGAAARKTLPLNSGEALVELLDPPAVVVLTMTNPDTNASATTVVTRPPRKQEEKKEGEKDK